MPFTTPLLGIKVEATGAEKIVYSSFFFSLFLSNSILGFLLIFLASVILGLYFVTIFTISVFTVSLA